MAKTTTFGATSDNDAGNAANWDNGLPVAGDTVVISGDVTSGTITCLNGHDDNSGHNIFGVTFVVAGTLDLTTSLSLGHSGSPNNFNGVATLKLPGGLSVVSLASRVAAVAAQLATDTAAAGGVLNQKVAQSQGALRMVF